MTKKSRRYQDRAPGATADKEVAKRDYNIDDDFFKSDAPERPDRTAKRAKFSQASAPPAGYRFNTTTIIVCAALVIVVGMVLFFQSQSSTSASGSAPAANAIREVSIQHTVAGGKIVISADEVRKNKLAIFDYQNGKTNIPLTAWVAPSGAIKTAVRICEPCDGKSFRIEGNTLVCNVCGTKWDLETLRGISGGCQKYPPDAIANVIDGDNVSFDEATVAAWTPRP